MKSIEKMRIELLDAVRQHDYSYMMSDSNAVYMSGVRAEQAIKELVHSLCAVHREDADCLLKECIEIRDEQYTDGLTHKVIHSWFKPYVETV